MENICLDTKIITRFPPEPNGYLHIGHAKAMFINFSLAKKSGGYCYMRFDDTNPIKEKQEYIDSILEDIKWLGHEPFNVTYTSDYFDKLYYYATELIKKNKAYVCQLDKNTMKEQRCCGIESPYRNRSIDESLKLFSEMSKGLHDENSMVLRLKCNMQSGNPNMRDLVAYRILFKSHARTFKKYVNACISHTFYKVSLGFSTPNFSYLYEKAS